jgi:hypothetical protein
MAERFMVSDAIFSIEDEEDDEDEDDL